jgi:DMSO/TMAO reductase YedYZ molybdopterin-dependent catalytic subunit
VSERFVTRGFVGRRSTSDTGDLRDRVPPGQYLTNDFPVLSAGPTPRTPLDRWSFRIDGLVREPVTWTWNEFTNLPDREWIVDISCVTKVIAYSDGGYTTNLPVADVLNGQAFVAWEYDGKPLAPEHGGPARLVVPGRYFWKSAKWIRGLRIQAEDEAGFWESLGYHNRGDQWREERYSGD